MASKKKTVKHKVLEAVAAWMVSTELPISDCEGLRRLHDAIGVILLTDCPIAIVEPIAKKKATRKK